MICRFGGDEFLCSVAGQDADGARERFEEIGKRLADATRGATITVGFAERTKDDTVEGLIGRADAALIGNPAPEAMTFTRRSGPGSPTCDFRVNAAVCTRPRP